MTKIINRPGCWTADLILSALQTAQTDRERAEVLDVLGKHFDVCKCGAVINDNAPVVPQDGLQRAQ